MDAHLFLMGHPQVLLSYVQVREDVSSDKILLQRHAANSSIPQLLPVSPEQIRQPYKAPGWQYLPRTKVHKTLGFAISSGHQKDLLLGAENFPANFFGGVVKMKLLRCLEWRFQVRDEQPPLGERV